MKTDKLTYTGVPTPCYIVEEDLLRNNLQLIKSVADRAGVEIILAFKAFALWKSFPIFREYRHVWHSRSLVVGHIHILRHIQKVISIKSWSVAAILRSIL